MLLSLKMQKYLFLKTKNRIGASLLFPFGPIVIIGILLDFICDYRVFDRGISYALIWLAIAPFLVNKADLVIKDFFESHKSKFKDEEIYTLTRVSFVSKYEKYNHIILNIAWILATSLVVTFTRFVNAPLSIKIWSFISFIILFNYSFIGFKGILLIPKIVKVFCSSKTRFEPLHHDSFGGFESIGKFIITGTFFFSSGSLVLPLVFSILREFANHNVLLSYSVYILTTVFIVILVYSFIAPILIVKKYLMEQKSEAIRISGKKLDKMYKEAFKKDAKIEKSSQLYFYNDIYHKKLYDIKEFPYDASVIFELTVSVLLPIGIAVIEILSHVGVTV